MNSKSQKNKYAFTFAELMISLLVISVLSAILYPTIAQFTPNANKPLFKAAYKNITSIIAEIVNEKPDGELPLCINTDKVPVKANSTCDNHSTSGEAICKAICLKSNVINTKDLDSDETTYDSDTAQCETYCTSSRRVFTTTNGMRWAIEKHLNSSDNTFEYFTILVDVNSSNNNLPSAKNETGLDGNLNTMWEKDTGRFDFNSDGFGEDSTHIYKNESKDFNKANLKIQDTFWIKIDKYGKVIDISPAGWANLEDNLDTED